jgi:hypothetical protein
MDFIVFSAYMLVFVWVCVGVVLERTCEYIRKAIVVVEGTDDDSSSLVDSPYLWQLHEEDYN